MGYTAFPGVEETLKKLIVSVDTDAFKGRRMPGCSASFCRCFGICCSLTVAVTAEEAKVITALLHERAGLFEKAGCRIPKDVFTTDPATGRRYIAQKRRPFGGLNAIILALIEDGTGDMRLFRDLQRVCVFSMANGSCALQKVSESMGLHKWHFKPVNCWKYPLSIVDDRLTLTNRACNPRFPCSKNEGVPAVESLGEELSYLGKIIGRDLPKEIAA